MGSRDGSIFRRARNGSWSTCAAAAMPRSMPCRRDLPYRPRPSGATSSTSATLNSWKNITAARGCPLALSLAQGPDTERAKTGVENLFGAGPARAMSSVYFISFKLRDGSYFVRFDYRDPSVIEQIAETKDMVKVTVSVRDDGRFDLRAYRDRLSWWIPDEINQSDALYVDRQTGEKIAGTLPRNEPVGFSRVLWVDERARIAHYREIEF